MLSFGAFQLDGSEERLWKHGKELALRRKPFAILKFLCANPRRLITHAELTEHVWAGNVVSDSALRTHLHELRQVLGEGLIETVIGRGYRFTVEPTAGVAPVESVQERASDADLGRIVVGREAELATLHAAFDRATAGHRQVCFVTGEPGIGKSTLVDTFTRSVEGADVVVVRGHCVEQHATPEPFLSVIEVLAQLRRSTIGELALASLIRHAPTFLAQLPHLIPDGQLDDVSRRARAGPDARSVRELIEALETMAANHTIVIVLEDLQWCDVATIDLIALLVPRRERARMLLIGTSRRADVQTVGHPLNLVMRTAIARFGAIALSLDRIAGVEIRRLVDLRFPDHAFPEGLIETIDRITAGTPLFVVSFIEDLVGRGMLEHRDRWRLAVSLDDVAAHRPDNVRQLIDIHLDRLAPEEQRLLEAASAVGVEFSTPLVAAALGASLETVDDLCDSLVRRALFLQRVGIEEWPDGTLAPRYGVTHGLVQEVNVERSPASRRQRWHQQIAERLEVAYGNRAAEVAHTLARHFDGGGLAARAVHYYVIAAARSTLRFASRDALALYERAHALIRRMPATPERDVIELGLLEGKTQSVIRSTKDATGTPLDIFAQMIAIARRLGDADRLAVTLANFRVRLVTLAEYDRADEIAAQLDELRQTQPLPPAAVALDTMGRILGLTWRGVLDPARAQIERETSDLGKAAVIAGMIGPTDSKSIFIVQLSIVHWLLGQPRAAERDVDLALARATANGDPYMLGHAYCSRARHAFLGGAPADDIRRPARAGLAIPDAEVWHPQCTLLVRLADSMDGPLAGPELDDMEELFRSRIREFPMGATYLGLVFASIAFHSCAFDRARAVLDDMIAFARSRGERIVEPELVRLRGALLEPSDPAAAAAAYLEAIARARAAQSRAFQLRAAISLAVLWRDDPRHAESRALLAEAVAHVTDETLDVAEARRLLRA